MLQETCLPPPHAFYSSLKQQNVLESDIFVKYCILVVQEGKEVQEALDIFNLTRPPLSQIENNYADLLRIWKRENMCTLLDYEIRRYMAMYDWMDWLNGTTNAGINHKMNNGKELRMGSYLVDGYNAQTNELWPRTTELWSEVRSVGVTLSLLSSSLPTWILLTSRKSNVKHTRGRSPSLMKAPSSFRACTLVHLSLKPGKTSTKSSGESPRITSRRIVDVGIPAPMIPAGENSDTIFKIPSRLLFLFSVYCSEMTTFLVSGT